MKSSEELLEMLSASISTRSKKIKNLSVAIGMIIRFLYGRLRQLKDNNYK